MALLTISFIAGILTVLTPSLLPLLPVVIGGSISGTPSKKRAIIVTASLGVSIVLFTFLLKVSSVFINIPQETWHIVSGFIIMLFGLISIAPEIWEDLTFIVKINNRGNKLINVGKEKDGFWGDVLIGVALGSIFSSSSPTYFLILATILPQSLFWGFICLTVYTVGLSLMLLLIVFWGQRLTSGVKGLSNTHSLFRRLIGFVFLITGIFIAFGFEKKIENWLNESRFNLSNIEEPLLYKTK